MTVGDLKKYKDNLYGALSRDLSDFEKNFLLIAAGVLAFSITFIKEIVNIQHACFLFCLFAGWFLFAFSVGMMMLTFIKSAYASDEIWFKVDEFIIAGNYFTDEKEIPDLEMRLIKKESNDILMKRKSQLRTMRYLAIGSFLAGLVFFGFFVADNIIAESKSGRQDGAKSIKTDKSTKSFMFNDSIIILKK